MAASTGLRHWAMAVSWRCSQRISSRRASRLRASQVIESSINSLSMPRSMPAQKCLPLPLSTATRASGVLSTQFIASPNSCHIGLFMALARSGRLSCKCATWLSSLRFSVVKLGVMACASSRDFLSGCLEDTSGTGIMSRLLPVAVAWSQLSRYFSDDGMTALMMALSECNRQTIKEAF